jgi:hypothetical protein
MLALPDTLSLHSSLVEVQMANGEHERLVVEEFVIGLMYLTNQYGAQPSAAYCRTMRGPSGAILLSYRHNAYTISTHFTPFHQPQKTRYLVCRAGCRR